MSDIPNILRRFRLFSIVALVVLSVCAVLPRQLTVPELYAAESANASATILSSLKGKNIVFRGKDLSVATLLESIGRKAGINIIVDDSITDTINISTDSMSLYDLFMITIESKKLSYTEKNNLLYISKAGDNIKPPEIITAKLCPRYGNASEYHDMLSPLLGEGGALTVSDRTNCLVVQDQERNIKKIRDTLAELDLPRPQVHIKASIVSVGKEAKKQLGIKWSTKADLDNTALGEQSFPVRISADNLAQETGNLMFGIMYDNLHLDIDLQALQENNLLRILSSPQILVLDGKEAQIKQGKEVPFVSQSQYSLNTDFREANLSLKVTPRVRKNMVALDIVVNNDSVDESTSSGEPLINKQEISTKLLLKTGVTVVIGGIIMNTKDNSRGGVPILKDLPILGNIFQSRSDLDSRQELMVFLTPTIINMGNNEIVNSSEAETKSLREETARRLISGGASVDEGLMDGSN